MIIIMNSDPISGILHYNEYNVSSTKIHPTSLEVDGLYDSYEIRLIFLMLDSSRTWRLRWVAQKFVYSI